MESSITIRLSGANIEATAQALRARLGQLGCSTVPGEDGVLCFVSPVAEAGSACDVHYVVDSYDPPDFAAEKILDGMAGKGLIHLEDPVAAVEEAGIEDRLKQLGYLE